MADKFKEDTIHPEPVEGYCRSFATGSTVMVSQKVKKPVILCLKATARNLYP
jgi:hypothetical protein